MPSALIYCLVLLYNTTFAGNQNSSIEKADFIVQAKVMSTEEVFAGGVVPISVMNMQIKDVLKNSGNLLNKDQEIGVLVYGNFSGNGFNLGSNASLPFLIRDGAEVIICIKRKGELFEFVDINDQLSISFIDNDTISNFDKFYLGKTKTGNNQKEEYLQYFNSLLSKTASDYKKEISDKLEFSANKSGKITLDDYKRGFKRRIDDCDMHLGKYSRIIAYAELIEKNIPQQIGEDQAVVMNFRVKKMLKGTIASNNIIISYPYSEYNIMPEFRHMGLHESSILFLDSENRLISTSQKCKGHVNDNIVNNFQSRLKMESISE
jgi:hypothetical protein